jgi:hypothetical protein
VARPRGGADHPGRGRPAARAGGQIARAVLIGAGLLATLGALAAGAGARGGAHARANGRAHAATAASTHLQVTQVEYRLLLSEAVVKAGPVSLEVIDGGMDPHNLDLRHGDSRAVISEAQLQPGQRFDGVVDLRPGVYHLWCSLPAHWKLGMHATLRVVR